MLALFLGLLLTSLDLAAQDPAARRLFAAADGLARGGDPMAALREYTLLQQQFPQDALAPAALLRMAELQRQLGDEATARATLEALSTQHGRSPQAAMAFVLQAEMDRDTARQESDLEAVRNTLRRVPILYDRAQHPRLGARARALFGSAELGLRLGDPAGAAAELVTLIEDEPEGPWTTPARLALGRAFLGTGDLSAALEVLARVAALEPGSGPDLATIPAQASRLLDLLNRRTLQPAIGRRPWRLVSTFSLAQLGVKGVGSVAAADDGRLLVVGSRGQVVALLAADGQVLDRRDLQDAGRAWFGPDGQSYVVTPDAILQPFSGSSIQFADPAASKGRNLADILVAERSPFGTWYILAKKARGLLTFENRRKGRSDLLAASSINPIDLARDSNGRLLVLDGEGDRILRLESGGSSTVLARGTWKKPIAIAIDPLGYLFALDRGERRLTIFDPQGQPQVSLGPELTGELALRNPVDVAVDGHGRVYIADAKLPFLVLVQ